MASISTADFKNGMCIINNGKMCTIVEFQHVKPGKGGAFVRTKLKDIKTGRVVDYTFNAGTKFDSVRLESKKMQYLYNDGADYWFMDNSTFEQMPVSADMVGSAADWLKENDEATLLYAGDELISLEPLNPSSGFHLPFHYLFLPLLQFLHDSAILLSSVCNT